jgi:hypothetical protein
MLFMSKIGVLMLVPFFFLGIGYSVQAQCLGQEYSHYYNNCNNALKLFVNQNYLDCAALYERTFQKYYAFPEDMNYLKKCYLLMGDTLQARSTLEKMILRGLRKNETTYLVNENVAIAGMSNPSFYEYSLDTLINYDSVRLVYLGGIDIEKDKYLSVFSSLDRYVGVLRLSSNSDTLANYCFERIKFLFMNFLNSTKVPLRCETGSYGDGFNLALIHIVLSIVDEKEGEELFKQLWELVLNGQIHPSQYAVLYDAYYMRVKGFEKSLFGASLRSRWGENGELIKVVVNIETPEKIDYLREDYFLLPLKYWCSLKGFELPDNYKN